VLGDAVLDEGMNHEVIACAGGAELPNLTVVAVDNQSSMHAIVEGTLNDDVKLLLVLRPASLPDCSTYSVDDLNLADASDVEEACGPERAGKD
jgi:hypothetical protein